MSLSLDERRRRRSRPNMPFHGFPHAGEARDGSSSSHSALGGIYHAAQTLGAVGAPSMRTNGPPSTEADALFAADSPAYTTPRRDSDLAMSNPASFDSSRRAFGRQPEELHIPVSGPMASAPRQQPHHQFAAPPDAANSNPPSLNQPSSQYGTTTASNALPGALQPGNTSRPPSLSTTAAPSAGPALPQLPAPSQPQPTTVTINSRGHSRSSPAGFDQQKYKQYGNTAETSKYVSPPGTGYQPHTPQGAKYSPLGLADIRPQGDSVLADVMMSPNSYNNGGESQVPTNSNYIAPWPIYAVDWSKWPMAATGSSAGKIAIGSYLEDSHNYVRLPHSVSEIRAGQLTDDVPDSNHRRPPDAA
ncbi:hypothetical protein VTN02DRAFT_1667 [Thermoascus thermophilus]